MKIFLKIVILSRKKIVIKQNLKKMTAMKKMIFSFIISGLFLTTTAQKTVVTPKIPIDTVTKKITYTEVVRQKGTKDTLYNRAIHWCGTFFKNSQSVTKVRDKENGKVEGIHRFKIYHAPLKDSTKVDAGMISYTFTIMIKENRYKYTITDLNVKGASYFALERWLDKKDPSYTTECDYFFTQVDKYMQDFVKSLKKGMLEAVKVKDEW
jgi:hypothetical protein